jgi:hypothetical protein
MPEDFRGSATPLADDDLEKAAGLMRCERAVIDAVCDVESAGSGFLPDKRPKILFEAHVFHYLTDGRWGRSHPGISSPQWNRALYGASGAHQYDRLAEAIRLDRDAALQSTSWGRFQVLGSNYAMAGFRDVEAFVAAMCESEAAHLEAFRDYCQKRGLVDPLRNKEWIIFARHYNGTGQVEHYAAALAGAYARHAAKPAAAGHPVLHLLSRGETVKQLQELLGAAGYEVEADGVFGQKTLAAVRQFQIDHDLGMDGVVGSQTWDALSRRR